MAAVRHLGFLKVRILHYGRPICVSMQNFVPIGWFSIFQDLFYVYLDHPRGVFVGLCRCAKFGWNWCSSFNNMPVLCFVSLAWKCHSRPFLGRFGGIWPPRWDTISTNLTKAESTCHSGSCGILIMLVSIVVIEKLPRLKKVWRRRRTWILGRFWRL